jgi:hypothetical protein
MGATADLNLSLNPLTQNRYGLAGGNPISFVEIDGHEPADGSFVNNPQPGNIYGGRSGRNVNWAGLRRQQGRTTTDVNSTGAGYGRPAGVAAKPYPVKRWGGMTCGRAPASGPAAGYPTTCPVAGEEIGVSYQCQVATPEEGDNGCYRWHRIEPNPGPLAFAIPGIELATGATRGGPSMSSQVRSLFGGGTRGAGGAQTARAGIPAEEPYARSQGIPLEIFTNAPVPTRGALSRSIREGHVIIRPIPD